MVRDVTIPTTVTVCGKAHCNRVTLASKMGGCIAAGIGQETFLRKIAGCAPRCIFILPIGFRALPSPIAGIMLVAYFVLRKSDLNQEALFSKHGEHGDSNGWNMRAIVALVTGVLPSLPGLLKTAGFIAGAAPVLEVAYTDAWFVGLANSALLYYLLMPPKAA